jgi:hypothetical protein
VTLATAIGGPLATGTLLAVNYRRIGRRSAARLAALGGVVATLLVLGTAWVLPSGFLDLLLAAAYLGIGHEVARQLQGGVVADHRSAGGSLHSPWRAVGVGLACVAAVLGLVAMLILLLPERWLPDV